MYIMNSAEFDRSKIYEKLSYQPRPENYNSKIPWIVQQQISATNGIHYSKVVGNLTEYPIPDIPISPATTKDQLLLDIGCGWGRWLVSSGKKGYIPLGIDLRVEFCQTARLVMKNNDVQGYTLVADLKNLPFKEMTFDVVWSYSVIQHTHRERLLACLQDINRILKPGGLTKLEFPNKNGIRNRFGPAKKFSSKANEYDSWCVRYYTIEEYRNIFMKIFENFIFQNHSFLGIGVLPGDLKYVKRFKDRLGVSMSLTLSKLTNLIPGLKYLSDSIYIEARKPVSSGINDKINEFQKLRSMNQLDNLAILPLLQCPISKTSLILNSDRTYLLSPEAQRKYPIVEDIPILIASESEQM